MTQEEFNVVLKSRFEKCESVLGIKAGEYARNNDRLSNFKSAAALMKTTPAKACLWFFLKHLVSISDMVNDLDLDMPNPPQVWNEKIGDAINYLILLEGIIYEDYQSSPIQTLTALDKPK